MDPNSNNLGPSTPASAGRLEPAIALPAYTYVPGEGLHPFSHPQGHRFGQDFPAPQAPKLDDGCTAFRLRVGIDLYNAGYYWEAHEQWEALWHACGRRSVLADFFKGLIQLAVAGVKHYQKLEESQRAHAHRAQELFLAVRQQLQADTCLGLSLADLAQLAQGTSPGQIIPGGLRAAGAP